MDITLKQLKADYAKVLKDLGIMKTKGIAQHVREYTAKHPGVSKTKARAIVTSRYKALDDKRKQAYVKLMEHEDTLLTDQVFTSSACLRMRSRKVTERLAKGGKPIAKKKTAKKPVKRSSRKKS